MRTYKPVVQYEYEVEGNRYEGPCIALVSIDSTSSAAQAKATQYSVGRKVDVFFDPNHPSDATLDRNTKIGPIALFLLFDVALVIVGILGVTGVIKFEW